MNKTTLTPDLINAATGRELDALVAEHVMGWRWWSCMNEERDGRHVNMVERMVIMPPASSGIIRWNFSEAVYSDVTDRDVKPERFADWDHNDLPRYSTDGNAMLAVLERMRELGWDSETVRDRKDPTGSFITVEFEDERRGIKYRHLGEDGEPEPLVTSRAALLTIAEALDVPPGVLLNLELQPHKEP